eukprot:s1798_g10.t1
MPPVGRVNPKNESTPITQYGSTTAHTLKLHTIFPTARRFDSCACVKNESRNYSSHYCKSFTNPTSQAQAVVHICHFPNRTKSDYQQYRRHRPNVVKHPPQAKCGTHGHLHWGRTEPAHPIAAFCCTAADHHITGKRTASRGCPCFEKMVLTNISIDFLNIFL